VTFEIEHDEWNEFLSGPGSYNIPLPRRSSPLARSIGYLTSDPVGLQVFERWLQNKDRIPVKAILWRGINEGPVAAIESLGWEGFDAEGEPRNLHCLVRRVDVNGDVTLGSSNAPVHMTAWWYLLSVLAERTYRFTARAVRRDLQGWLIERPPK